MVNQNPAVSSAPGFLSVRRNQIGVAVGGAAAILLLVALIPSLVSKSYVANVLTKALGTPVALERASVGWFSGVTLQGVTVQSGAAFGERPLLTLDSVIAPLSLWQLFSGKVRAGAVEIYKAQMTVARNENGDFNFAGLAQTMEDVATAGVRLREGTVIVQVARRQEVKLTEVGLQTKPFEGLDREIAYELSFKLEGHTFVQEGAITFYRSDKLNPMTTVRSKFSEIELSSLLPSLGLVALPAQVKGKITGEARLTLDGTRLTALSGQAKVNHLSLSDGQTRLTLPSEGVETEWDLAFAGEDLQCRQARLRLPFATAEMTGEVKGFSHEPQGKLALTLVYDLAKMPEAMRQQARDFAAEVSPQATQTSFTPQEKGQLTLELAGHFAQARRGDWRNFSVSVKTPRQEVVVGPGKLGVESLAMTWQNKTLQVEVDKLTVQQPGIAETFTISDLKTRTSWSEEREGLDYQVSCLFAGQRFDTDGKMRLWRDGQWEPQGTIALRFAELDLATLNPLISDRPEINKIAGRLTCDTRLELADNETMHSKWQLSGHDLAFAGPKLKETQIKAMALEGNIDQAGAQSPLDFRLSGALGEKTFRSEGKMRFTDEAGQFAPQGTVSLAVDELNLDLLRPLLAGRPDIDDLSGVLSLQGDVQMEGFKKIGINGKLGLRQLRLSGPQLKPTALAEADLTVRVKQINPETPLVVDIAGSIEKNSISLKGNVALFNQENALDPRGTLDLSVKKAPLTLLRPLVSHRPDIDDLAGTFSATARVQFKGREDFTATTSYQIVDLEIAGPQLPMAKMGTVKGAFVLRGQGSTLSLAPLPAKEPAKEVPLLEAPSIKVTQGQWVIKNLGQTNEFTGTFPFTLDGSALPAKILPDGVQLKGPGSGKLEVTGKTALPGQAGTIDELETRLTLSLDEIHYRTWIVLKPAIQVSVKGNKYTLTSTGMGLYNRETKQKMQVSELKGGATWTSWETPTAYEVSGVVERKRVSSQGSLSLYHADRLHPTGKLTITTVGFPLELLSPYLTGMADLKSVSGNVSLDHLQFHLAGADQVESVGKLQFTSLRLSTSDMRDLSLGDGVLQLAARLEGENLTLTTLNGRCSFAKFEAQGNIADLHGKPVVVLEGKLSTHGKLPAPILKKLKSYEIHDLAGLEVQYKLNGPVDNFAKLQLQSTVKIGQVKFKGFNASQVETQPKLAEGKLSAPLKCVLNEGRFQASIDGQLREGYADTYTVKLDLQNARLNREFSESLQYIAPIFYLPKGGATGEIKGLLTISLSLLASGADRPSLENSLSGEGPITITDGSVDGPPIYRALLKAVGLSYRPYTFSRMDGKIRIKDRWTYTDDLKFRDPWLNMVLQGKTSFAGQIEYGLSVDTLKKLGLDQVAKEFLKSDELPVKITGTWEKPKIVVPFLGDISNAKPEELIQKGLEAFLGGNKKKKKEEE